MKNIKQIYRQYIDYDNYPEGETRHALVRATRITAGEAQDLRLSGVLPTQQGGYNYYRIYVKMKDKK